MSLRCWVQLCACGSRLNFLLHLLVVLLLRGRHIPAFTSSLGAAVVSVRTLVCMLQDGVELLSPALPVWFTEEQDLLRSSELQFKARLGISQEPDTLQRRKRQRCEVALRP